MSKYRPPFVPKDFPEDFDEQLRIINQCPICDTKFNVRQSRILEDREDSHLVYLNCRKCFNSVVALIQFGLHGISSIGMVTDLTYEDVIRFKDGDKVNFDDVLVAHEALTKNEFINKIDII